MKNLIVKLSLFSLLVVIIYGCSSPDERSNQAMQDFDVVILNGRVIDPETSYDKVSNVGIKDGKIAVITEKEISGKKTIDEIGRASCRERV